MKLYTKTVCPKCLWVKSEFADSELEYETINIDHDESAKEVIVSKGFMGVPILEVNGEFIADVNEIIAKIKELAE